jgi:uncharacterized repeat protein (TIGR02543 family)
MPANPYARAGYTFAGWAVSGFGSIIGIHTAGASVPVSNLSTAINTGNAGITLTATWLADQGITISFEQIVNQAPLLDEDVVIHRSAANGQTTKTITLTNPDQYDPDSIHWYVYNIHETGSSFTLDSSNIIYHMLGTHFLTLEVSKDGIPFNRTITFRVEE